MTLLCCNKCQKTLSSDLFYFRKDTKKFHPSCKKFHNKNTWSRHKQGLIKKRVVFDFKCLNCNIQKTSSDFYLKYKNINRYDTTCKDCRKKCASEWHKTNYEISVSNKKRWYLQNRDRMVKRCKERYMKIKLEDPHSLYIYKKNLGEPEQR